MKIKVLVPVDLTEMSDTALECIRLLAHREQMDVCLIHCFDDLLVSGPGAMGGDLTASQYQAEQVLRRNEADAREKLAALEEKLREVLATSPTAGCEVRSEFVWGTQDDTILEYAEKYGPDLILVVRHGESSWFDRLFGTMSRDLVGDSSYPVLSITSEVGLKRLDHILFASDFKSGDTQAIEKIRAIFSPFQPKLSCVHVRQSDDNETDAGTRERVTQLGVQVEMVEGEELTETLVAEMRHHNASLLAVNTRLRSHFQQFLHKGATGHLLNDTQLPILSMHVK